MRSEAAPDRWPRWTADLPVPPGGWPPAVWDVPYDPAAIPGCRQPRSWLEGSNCQRFAYGLLGLFGHPCPTLRSSELWLDTEATRVATEPRALDLVLFNGSAVAYGAHVGLCVAPGVVLHLSREVGRPAAWSLDDFAVRPRYATLIGFKRVLAPPGSTAGISPSAGAAPPAG